MPSTDDETRRKAVEAFATPATAVRYLKERGFRFSPDGYICAPEGTANDAVFKENEALAVKYLEEEWDYFYMGIP